MTKISPQTLIQMAFDDAKGDRQVAAKELVRRAESNADLRDHLVIAGASAVVGNLVCTDRKRILSNNPEATVLRMPQPANANAHRERVGRAAIRNVRMMLDMTLYGGKKKLREANHADLLESAASFEAQGAQMLRQTAFQRMVASLLPAGKLVGQAFDNERLSALYDQTAAKRDAA